MGYVEKRCKHCNALYNPLLNYGTRACKVHRLPVDPLTKRFPCCGVQMEAEVVQCAVFPPHRLPTLMTRADFLGCYYSDHDLDLPDPTSPWAKDVNAYPIEMVRGYNPLVRDARKNGRIPIDPVGEPVELTDFLSYQVYAVMRPSFAAALVAIPNEDEFIRRIHVPLVRASIIDVALYSNLSEQYTLAPGAVGPGFTPNAIHLIEQLIVAVDHADQSRRRVAIGTQVASIGAWMNSARAALPGDIPLFCSRMIDVVNMLFHGGYNGLNQSDVQRILSEWVGGVQARIGFITLLPVLRVETTQDAETLARAAWIAKDLRNYR